MEVTDKVCYDAHMKKLIIHPRDRSTEFLSDIYSDLDDATLVTGSVGRAELKRMIDSHDQVIMLGHGTPHGLMSVGQFPDAPGFVIDDSFADQLAEKKNSVYIWCNADKFVDWNVLSGFYTGMFISDTSEAYSMGLGYTLRDEVDESNSTFVTAVSRVIDCVPEMIHSYVKHAYGELIHRNAVAKYNHARLYIN